MNPDATVYYHASQTAGIMCLEPRVSNHGVPLVYFSSKRENVLVYLSNAVEKYCKESGFEHAGKWAKWGPYGFTNEGLLLLEEYYPNALEETYKGVSAYIYSAESEDGMEKLEGIPDAYVSEVPVPVRTCEYVPDAYAEIMRSREKGEIVLRRYEEMTPPKLEWIRQTVIGEYKSGQGDDYRHFLWAKFPFLHKCCEKHRN